MRTVQGLGFRGHSKEVIMIRMGLQVLQIEVVYL